MMHIVLVRELYPNTGETTRISNTPQQVINIKTKEVI